MATHAALDPGGKTGAAVYDGFTPLRMQEIVVSVNAWEALIEWLYEAFRQGIETLIVEGYRNRPPEMTGGHANMWSENLESQIVGYCRCYCTMTGINFVLQDPSIKPVGYGNAGLKYVKGKKGMHMQDALAHGAYWWINGRKAQ